MKSQQDYIRSKNKTTALVRRFNRLFRHKRVRNNQRIKMLQIALEYTLPKLKQEVDEVEDLPLFVG